MAAFRVGNESLIFSAMKTLLLAIWICTPGLVLCGQGDTLSTAQRQQEMMKLDWMIGRWEGSGWIDMGREGKREFQHTQTVRSKSGGLVLLLDGEGKAKLDGSTICSNLRLLSFAPRDVTFRWQEFTADGTARMNEAHAQQRMLQVGFPPTSEESARVGAGTFRSDLLTSNEGWVRFTISLNAKGEWIETGEMMRSSNDEEKWFRFLEILLHRTTE